MSGWHEVTPGDFDLHPALDGVVPEGYGAISEPQVTDDHVTQYVMAEGGSFAVFDGGELELGLIRGRRRRWWYRCLPWRWRRSGEARVL